MTLKTDDVTHIAKLAKIALDDTLRDKLTDELNHIFSMVDTINGQNTDGIAPLSHPLDMTQRLRDDIVTETDQHARYERIAPNTQHDLYVVPPAIETE
jgi:aspartyl-tRNA(Asn)/glutamyl-tRNA(Gln) amidotransferase subunit C